MFKSDGTAINKERPWFRPKTVHTHLCHPFWWFVGNPRKRQKGDMNHRKDRFHPSKNCIRISPSKNGYLTVHLPYSPVRLARIRSISGRRWNSKKKEWLIPQREDTIQQLRTLFRGSQSKLIPHCYPGNPRSLQDKLH